MLTNLAQNVSMSTERRDAVIDAAYRCFLRYGVRRTTMDDIAAEAGMSRPAVYQHVANKNAAFRLVAERLFGRALEAAQTAAAAGSDVNERLFLLLETKLDLTLRLFRETPHAAELLDESVTLTGDLVSAYTRDLVALVATTLRAANMNEPTEVAEISVALVRGLEADLTDPELPRRRLRHAVALLTSGVVATRSPEGAKT